MPTCSSCRFGEVVVGDDDRPYVECRRHPPIVIVLDAEPCRLWPQVSASDWCGDWEQAPAAGPREPLPQPGEPSMNLLADEQPATMLAIVSIVAVVLAIAAIVAFAVAESA